MGQWPDQTPADSPPLSLPEAAAGGDGAVENELQQHKGAERVDDGERCWAEAPKPYMQSSTMSHWMPVTSRDCTVMPMGNIHQRSPKEPHRVSTRAVIPQVPAPWRMHICIGGSSRPFLSIPGNPLPYFYHTPYSRAQALPSRAQMLGMAGLPGLCCRGSRLQLGSLRSQGDCLLQSLWPCCSGFQGVGG